MFLYQYSLPVYTIYPYVYCTVCGVCISFTFQYVLHPIEFQYMFYLNSRSQTIGRAQPIKFQYMFMSTDWKNTRFNLPLSLAALFERWMNLEYLRRRGRPTASLHALHTYRSSSGFLDSAMIRIKSFLEVKNY